MDESELPSRSDRKAVLVAGVIALLAGLVVRPPLGFVFQGAGAMALGGTFIAGRYDALRHLTPEARARARARFWVWHRWLVGGALIAGGAAMVVAGFLRWRSG